MVNPEHHAIGDETGWADSELSPALDLEPGETPIWTGRPGSIGRLVLRAIPRSLFGLFFIGFTVVWIIAVVRGDNNNWDRGRRVGPFAPHNVLIAAGAGLWMLPPGIVMLTWPFRQAWRLRRSHFVLTDRRAIVIEPRILRRNRVSSYPPESLGLMRREEQPDGSGDLIFEDRMTGIRIVEPVGFLAVEGVGELESLVRKTLAPGRLPGALLEPGEWDSLAGRSYRLRGASLVLLAVLGVIFSLTSLMLLASFLAVPIVLIFVKPNAPEAIAAATVVLALLSLGFLFPTGWLLRIPFAITIDEKERSVRFRSWTRSLAVPVADFRSVTTGTWRDPSCVNVDIRHKGGQITLFNKFTDFRDFLVRLKALNPSVEIKGF